MIFIACDGDNIGSVLERAIIENNETALFQYSNEVSQAVKSLETWFTEAGGQVVFSGGDNILIRIARSYSQVLANLPPFRSGGIRFSVGIGGSPREAWTALKYAKTNKPAVVTYCNGEFMFVSINEIT
jgi:hypothetical protein